MNAQAARVKRIAKRREIVNRRLAARYDHEIRMRRKRFVRERSRRNFLRGNGIVRAPRSRRITPFATNRATEKPNKKRRAPGVCALALPTSEFFEYGIREIFGHLGADLRELTHFSKYAKFFPSSPTFTDFSHARFADSLRTSASNTSKRCIAKPSAEQFSRM